MLTLHDDIELTCGDEWVIAGTLLDQDGNPINLDPSVELRWTLLDPDGARIPIADPDATLERVDPITSGQVVITLPADLTSTFRPGRYTDALQVQIDGAPSTLWRGLILASADPFYAEMLMATPPAADTFEDAPNDGQLYVRQNKTWVVMPVAAPAAPAISFTLEYTFAKQTVTPPTNSQARLDNLDPAQVAKIWLNNNDANSIDDSNLIGMVKPGSDIFLQDKDDPTLWARYTTTQFATNAGTYCEIPVLYVSSQGTLNDNQRIIVFIHGGG